MPLVSILKSLLFLPLIVVILSSCSTGTAPNFKALAVQDRQQLADWPGQEGAEKMTSLSELIGSPELDALIAEALTANPGLQQTLLTLQILRAERGQVAADRLPEVSLDGGAEKEEGGDESYSGSLSISWEVDLWQKLADSEGAATMDVAEQEALFQAAR
ncbi:MAG: TolC family protein, partial [Proteobacteria bacterium]|nr:TolC family protein [Pseudomonadota bacterium]